jgi:hypothetical protein
LYRFCVPNALNAAPGLKPADAVPDSRVTVMFL